MTPALNDFGPIYVETDLTRFPVEPWNTASNLIFLVIVIFFAWRTRLDYRTHPLIVFGLPVLFIGFVGGTVYHATRSHRIWLMLDFIPIFILTAAAALKFWKAVVGRWSYALFGFFACAVSPRLLAGFLSLPFHYRISVGYAGLALAILLPATIDCRRNRGENGVLLLFACVAFGVAVVLRTLDRAGVALFPMGTHFLWHLLGGVSVWCLMEYTIRGDKMRARSSVDLFVS